MTAYCLDTNVFIEAWDKYYAQDLCPAYWDWLVEQARTGRVFATMDVYREIEKKTDALTVWAKAHKEILFREFPDTAFPPLRSIMAHEKGKRLADNTKNRSIADPVVIAHAIAEAAVVVTKEERMPDNSQKIKIPNVCEAFQVPWMTDFEFIRRVGFRMARG